MIMFLSLTTPYDCLFVSVSLFSGEEEQAQHHDLRTHSAEHMCYFTQRRLQGIDRLPDETKDILQKRIDPNLWEAGRSAIDALLYIPGSKYALFTA